MGDGFGLKKTVKRETKRYNRESNFDYVVFQRVTKSLHTLWENFSVSWCWMFQTVSGDLTSIRNIQDDRTTGRHQVALFCLHVTVLKAWISGNKLFVIHDSRQETKQI